MKKSDLVDRIRETRSEFESLLATLEPDQITHGGSAGGWSVKGALAHNALYQREGAELFGETRR